MSNFAGPEVQNNNLVLALDAANPRSFNSNVFPNPLDIFAFTGSIGTNCTLSSDITITDSPVKGTPLKMVATGLAPMIPTYSALVWNIAPASFNQIWTLSVYVKALINTNIKLGIAGSTNTGLYKSYVNSSLLSIDTEWKRLSFTCTLTSQSTTNIQIVLTGSTITTIWFDGLQLEQKPEMGYFNPVPNINGKMWRDLVNPNIYATLGTDAIYSNNSKGIVHIESTANGFVKLSSANFNLMSVNNTVIVFSRYSDATNLGGRIVTAWDNNWLLGHHGSYHSSFYANAWVNNPTSLVAPTAWRMYTGTVNVTTGSCELYVNDQLVTTTVIAAAQGPSGLYFGGSTYLQYAEGEVALLLAYNRILTNVEIAQIFNAYRSRFSI